MQVPTGRVVLPSKPGGKFDVVSFLKGPTTTCTTVQYKIEVSERDALPTRACFDTLRNLTVCSRYRRYGVVAVPRCVLTT